MNKSYALESTLTKHVSKYLNSQADVFAQKISDRTNKGISDFICCASGIMVAIELKAREKKPTAHQLLFIKQVQNVGGIGGVCYTLRDVENLLEEARRCRRKI